VLAVDEGTSTAWHSLDLKSGELTRLTWPCEKGWLLHFAAEHRTAVPVAVDHTGTRLWLSRPAFEQHRVVLETNTWLEHVAEGEITRVDYRGLDGNELKGWLILPVGYQQGRRYPLISWVYPGLVFRNETPPTRMTSITSHHVLNYQLLPARGYAVLLPSMPLQPEGDASDPYLELTKGVLPAVDKAIELGVADPERLGVIGQSNGGYGTYGLITQTHRFNAAVVLAGAADLIAFYGQFDPRFRYDGYAHEHLFRMSLSESGQLRMGGPPWEAAERYERNSPLFHADRVETPLLILQGDMDYVPLEQGEQFFTALYRQGKRARFVRYWGEGHVFQSPANIRNMWDEIYGWLDEFLKPSVGDPPR
jgi:dipeptidyl aminopeptidase/acylaminoacyl peptidase